MKVATRATVAQHPSPSTRKHLPPVLALLLLSIALLASILVAISFGSVAIPFTVIVSIVLNGTHIIHFSRQWDPSLEVIIWQVRLPGVIGAALVGTALAVAGTLFQAVLRNPLADPFLLGTSSGAALGAAIAFILPFDTFYGSFFPLTPALAFAGALLTVLFVYSIARSAGRTPVVTLLLAGVVLNAVMVAFQTLLLTLSPNARFSINALFNWLSGGIATSGWPPIIIVGAITVAALVPALGLSSILDAFALGEETAGYLGLHVERLKFVVIILASLITAAAVSISGLIGFVGLVTPHVMRLLLGSTHRALLPASALTGAIFLVLADLLARTTAAPAVLPVGVFTALVGAPFFLYLLRRNKREYQW